MNQIFLISIIISFTLACQKNQLRCENLLDKISCESAQQRVATCYWNQYNNQCQLQRANCSYYQNEEECQSQSGCGWYEEACQKLEFKMSELNCDNYSTYASCIGVYQGNQGCTWEHERCIKISKCSEINDFMQCRNSILKDKCQLVVNGQSSHMEKQYFYLGNIFDEYECRAQDCRYNLSSSCDNFKNGRRCFQYYGECTQCSYLTNKQSCIEPNQCTWENNICRNILCSDLKGKQQCQQKPFCQFNDTNQLCETRIENNLYCYAYDIPSDPIKSKKKVEI